MTERKATNRRLQQVMAECTGLLLWQAVLLLCWFVAATRLWQCRFRAE